MRIKKLDSENIRQYEDIILELLINSYESNFQLENGEYKEICEEKIQLLKEYIDNDTAIVIGAFREGELVGFLWIYIHQYFGEKRMHVNHISVRRQFRGKGIGKSLMNELERQAKNQGIENIDLFVSEKNKDAMKMYTEMGFVTERRYMKRKL